VVAELPELLLKDARAWRAWLKNHHEQASGVWLVLAKKGTTEPTRLRYDEALEEALCHGWIDGQLRRRDDATYQQRFTPRRPRSPWSQRNVSIAERLVGEGRMHPAGAAAIAQAKADGRWDAAYPGQAAITVSADLAASLAVNPAATRNFELLSRQNRYALLYKLHHAQRAETRRRMIEQFVAMLARGETLHPQRSSPAG
jgi:uncharacterized protein YdeI (YjbR/CyaY-like superfamily)